MQVAQAGDAEQVGKARKILADARRGIYLLLADADPVDDVPAPAASDEPPADAAPVDEPPADER